MALLCRPTSCYTVLLVRCVWVPDLNCVLCVCMCRRVVSMNVKKRLIKSNQYPHSLIRIVAI